jgi:uncharacterized membrane protein
VTRRAMAAAGWARRALRFRPHLRFYLALLTGIAVWVATWNQHPQVRILLAGDAFFLLYVAEMLRFMVIAEPKALRTRAAEASRRGAGITLAVAGTAVLLSLIAIFTLLNHPRDEGRLFPILAVASVPLSWAMVHTVAAFQYARLYWRPPDPEAGLDFPGGQAATAFDFVYHAFVVGMCFAVSDVITKDRKMRTATLVHGMISFLFNTVLIALAVNAAMTFAG